MSETSFVDEIRSRRNFLRKATTISLGTMALTILPGSFAAEEGGGDDNADSPSAPDDGQAKAAADTAAGKPPVFAFLVDTNVCIGAGKCLTACRNENDVPEGFNRTWVERYVVYKDGRVQVDLVPETGYHGSGVEPIDIEQVERSYFVPKLCNQCEDAPCNQVCPVHASITSPEGVELVDVDQCIGCGYCVQACPYGSRFMNPKTHSADKCNWCYHRIMRDDQPACVEACPTGARVFGRLDDPNSEISKRLAVIPTDVLKGHLGTRPQTVYTLLPDEVI